MGLANLVKILAAILFGNHPVEHDQVDRRLGKILQRLPAARRANNVMAGNFEKAANDILHRPLVVHHQNMPAQGGYRLERREVHHRRLRRFLGQARQINGERGSFARLAGDGDEALMAANDAERDGEPEAGPLAHFLGGEERIEGLREHLGRHA